MALTTILLKFEDAYSATVIDQRGAAKLLQEPLDVYYAIFLASVDTYCLNIRT